MKNRIHNKIVSSEITSEENYNRRREFIKSGLILGAGSLATYGRAQASKPALISELRNNLTPLRHITNYNNFYEFSTNKEAVAELAKDFNTANWTLSVGGECDNPKLWTIEDLVKKFASEERIYRFRCVEGWSMVIPWQGFELRKLLQLAKPNSRAKYVAFETLEDKKQFPNQGGLINNSGIDWPYREGLRIDEAMHPLTIIATGLYGKDSLPNQNGAPLRLVVPWKYGFKSIKSIVKITFVEQEPLITWKQQNHQEYGFYSNVNPNVSHPRWSQSKERVIGGGFFKVPTKMFNGYEEEVASLYKGMDLKKHF